MSIIFWILVTNIARSAIFSPIKNLGLVIIDEEHESSYISDQNPKYYTHEVAELIC